jgi:predicted transcriptional regulator of viral defense system
MQQSIYKTIKNKILKYKRGKIIFPINFKKIGNEESVKKALFRLERKGFLIRLAHGIYLYPQKDIQLGILYPSVDSIAKAIAKRDKARILPTGTQAMNMLGLSTQIPLNVVYLTDASPRTIELGSRKISFKKTSHKDFQAKENKQSCYTSTKNNR